MNILVYISKVDTKNEISLIKPTIIIKYLYYKVAIYKNTFRVIFHTIFKGCLLQYIYLYIIYIEITQLSQWPNNST